MTDERVYCAGNCKHDVPLGALCPGELRPLVSSDCSAIQCPNCQKPMDYFGEALMCSYTCTGCGLRAIIVDDDGPTILRRILKQNAEPNTNASPKTIDDKQPTGKGLDATSCLAVPESVAREIRETWIAAREAGGEMQAFRIIERMVDRLGYGRIENNPPLLSNLEIG